MKTKTVNDGVLPTMAELDAMSIEDRVKMLDAAISSMQSCVALAGMLLISLKNSGYDISKIRKSLSVPLQKVAAGLLLVDAYIAYHDSPEILKRMAKLSHQEQTSLVKNGTVKLLAFIDGKTTDRQFELAELTTDQLNLVFADDHVRTIEEQAKWLAASELSTKIHPRKRTGSILYDPKSDTFKTTGPVSRKEMLTFLRTNGFLKE